MVSTKSNCAKDFKVEKFDKFCNKFFASNKTKVN